jgi:DNA primase catalytic subunit
VKYKITTSIDKTPVEYKTEEKYEGKGRGKKLETENKDLKAENKKINNELKELKKGNNMVKYENIWKHDIAQELKTLLRRPCTVHYYVYTGTMCIPRLYVFLFLIKMM